MAGFGFGLGCCCGGASCGWCLGMTTGVSLNISILLSTGSTLPKTLTWSRPCIWIYCDSCIFIKLDTTTSVPLLTLASMSKSGETLTCPDADAGLGALRCNDMTFDSATCSPLNLVKTITSGECAFAYNVMTGTICLYRYRKITITS